MARHLRGGSLHLRRDHSQLNIRCAAFINPDRPAAIFELPDEFRILPCSGLDVFPRENSIITGRNAFEVEMAKRVCRDCAVQVEAIAT